MSKIYPLLGCVFLACSGCAVHGDYAANVGVFGGDYLSLHRDGTYRYIHDTDEVNAICADVGAWHVESQAPNTIVTISEGGDVGGGFPACVPWKTRKLWIVHGNSIVGKNGVNFRKR